MNINPVFSKKKSTTTERDPREREGGEREREKMKKSIFSG